MDPDSFHRVAKLFADSGEARTIEAAEDMLSSYGVRVVLGDRVRRDPALQVIALTVINTASRTFLGNVQIEPGADLVLCAPGFEGTPLSQFVDWAHVEHRPSEASKTWPEICVGETDASATAGAICPWADGWAFGLGVRRLRSNSYFAPACVAAGGLAVSEAFSVLRADNPYSGRRSLELSLWSPGTSGDEIGPEQSIEVPGAWLVGLGHLGQAYAWTLGFMQPAEDAILVLQDIDTVTKSTLSTSVLTGPKDVRQRKTRLVARWLEARGYQTTLVERRFDEHQRVAAMEPRVALFGVDNAAARRVVEGAGFSTVIDAGLGSGFRDFRAIRLRTFPGPSSAASLWATAAEGTAVTTAHAYQALLAKGADPCGVTTLATRDVGAPFVGCVTAGYVVAELLRRQVGVGSHAVIDLNLRDPRSIQVIS